MTIEEVLFKLRDFGAKRENQQWKSRCPAHKDNTPSLAISQGLGGRVLFKCFAGCASESIAAAIGVTMSDLMGDKDFVAKETLPKWEWPIKATYVYEDAKGNPVYRIHRRVSPDSGKKVFSQERANGTGWSIGKGAMDGVTRIPYRLPRLIGSSGGEPVIHVEGEKCADKLTSLGFVATTSPGGSGGWKAELAQHYRGRAVVIIPDNDKPGQKYADAVFRSMDGIATSVKVLRLPVTGEGDDVIDWLEAGGTADELRAMIRRLSQKQEFLPSADRIMGERSERLIMAKGRLTFGVKFLDDALGGIMPRDLIIFGAKSGTGKTSLATVAAMANARSGKRVHYFALEAENTEIERRMKYQIAADLYYRRKLSTHRIRFLDWYQGAADAELAEFDQEAEAEMQSLTRNLHTFYRFSNFTSDDFCRQLESIKDDTDLVVLDHFHFVDSADDNENRAFKKTAKQIRDTALEFQKPIIVVAHVRKTDRRAGYIIPDMDDFHGSSDVPKMATKIVMIAPDFETRTGSPSLWSTYMHVAKCRTDSSVTRYVARVEFSTKTDSYGDAYVLGRATDGGKGFEEIESREWPSWKSNASAAVAEPDDDWFDRDTR